MKIYNVFDRVEKRLSSSLVSLREAELLQHTHWDQGEDARLREDIRFRQTPWGRWMPSAFCLANDAVYQKLLAQPGENLAL